jgi:DNA-binding beta-propeller fold protein YncE
MKHTNLRTFSGILSAALLTATVASAQLTPVDCADGTLVVQDRPSAGLFEGDGLDPAFCPDLGIELNNLGWRSVDRLLYGVELTNAPNGNNGLVRVGGNCEIEPLGFPVSAPGVAAWPADERVHTGGLDRLFVVDLPPVDSGQPPTLTAVRTFADSGNVHDWAYHPAFVPAEALLFGGDSGEGEIAVLDAATGIRTDFAVPGLPTGVSYGGASFNPAGNLVLHRNSGTVFEIDVSDLANPTIVDARPARSSGFNDATSCRQLTLDDPCDEAYFLQDVGSRLFRTNDSSASFTGVVELCGAASWQFSNPTLDPMPADLELNNMCFRGQDRMIYALELTSNGNNGLVRFAPDSCEIERLNVHGDLPAGQRFDAGDCTADGQAMLVNIGGVRTKFYRIDLDAMTSSQVTIRRATRNANWVGLVHDWAYNPADGKFYGGDSSEGHLASLELVWSAAEGKWIGFRQDRNLVNFSLPSGGGQLGAYGGAWFDADGNLVLHRNDGSIYEIDIATRELVDTSSSRSSGFNDGASCVGLF